MPTNNADLIILLLWALVLGYGINHLLKRLLRKVIARLVKKILPTGLITALSYVFALWIMQNIYFYFSS